MINDFVSKNELSEISEKKEFQRPVVKTEFVGYIDKWNEKISVHDEVFYPYGDLFLVIMERCSLFRMVSSIPNFQLVPEILGLFPKDIYGEWENLGMKKLK